MKTSKRVPVSTYRVQLNSEFGFSNLINIIEYLRDLGIKDIYASPVLTAKKGSTHGYDIIDHRFINPELGGEKLFREVLKKTADNEMGWIQDIVPNHMAFDSENPLLRDMLQNGIHSEYIKYFDIDWNHTYENLKGRLLAPFLGKLYGKCLNDKEINVLFSEKGFFVKYNELLLPLRISSYINILNKNLKELKNTNSDMAFEAESIIAMIDSLNANTDSRSEKTAQITNKLYQLYSGNSDIKAHIDKILSSINEGAVNENNKNMMDELLSEQLFRLSYWKVGNEELNYRRFFTVNSLICLKMENKDVFDYAHTEMLKYYNEGGITGFRIDHIDGLYSPIDYLKKLKKKAPEAYIVVEKILAKNEHLPGDWPVEGTTGYDFVNYLNGLFVDTSQEKKFKRVYKSFSKKDHEFTELVAAKKRLFMGRHMAGDIDNLAHTLKRIFTRSIEGRDATMYGIKRALVEVMAYFPVYRTYAGKSGLTDQDRKYMAEAFEKARNSDHGLSNEIGLIEKVMFLNYDDNFNKEEQELWIYFVQRFQQFSGALMAKGAEDTVFYIYNRLLSANEVGGDPSKFGFTLEEFHEFNSERSKNFPLSMNATSTHDTKRGEDARARINVLSEIPQEWNYVLKKYEKMNKNALKKYVIDKNDEYFIYQALMGSLPFEKSEYQPYAVRFNEFIIKAFREAKMKTSWIKPNLFYEKSVLSFIDELLNDSPNNEFLNEFGAFSGKIAFYGALNSISAVLLKVASPGVSDFYQGCELWDFSFVDPDNRRRVDYNLRFNILKEVSERTKIGTEYLDMLMKDYKNGKIKFYIIYKLLHERAKRKELYLNGEYLPLAVYGRHAGSIIAFARRYKDEWAVAVAPRFLTQFVKENAFPLKKSIWEDTHILLPQGAPSDWKNIFTDTPFVAGDKMYAGDVFDLFAPALLISKLRS